MGTRPHTDPKYWHHWPEHCTGCRSCHPDAQTMAEIASHIYRQLVELAEVYRPELKDLFKFTSSSVDRDEDSLTLSSNAPNSASDGKSDFSPEPYTEAQQQSG